MNEPPHIQESCKVIKKFNKIAEADGLSPFGIGGSFFKDIEEFHLDYNYFVNDMSVDKARWLIVTKAEELFALANQPSVKPYLRHNPYQEDNVQLSIGFLNKNWQHMPEGILSRVSVCRGIVFFSDFSGRSYRRMFTEPYAEAYQKVYGVPLPDRRAQFGELR